MTTELPKYTLLPCQIRWMTNKVTGMNGVIYLVPPCNELGRPSHYTPNVITVGVDIPSDLLARAIVDLCARKCPYHSDIERIAACYNGDIPGRIFEAPLNEHPACMDEPDEYQEE